MGFGALLSLGTLLATYTPTSPEGKKLESTLPQTETTGLSDAPWPLGLRRASYRAGSTHGRAPPGTTHQGCILEVVVSGSGSRMIGQRALDRRR